MCTKPLTGYLEETAWKTIKWDHDIEMALRETGWNYVDSLIWSSAQNVLQGIQL